MGSGLLFATMTESCGKRGFLPPFRFQLGVNADANTVPKVRKAE